MSRLSRPRMPAPCLAARRFRRQPRRAGGAAGAASEQRERRGRAVAAAGRKWRFFYLYVTVGEHVENVGLVDGIQIPRGFIGQKQCGMG